jgi:hypothetical protein
LNSSGFGVHLFFELFNGAEVLDKRLLKRPTGSQVSPSLVDRGQIFPKQRMVDVS